jgi:hypothetical protein
VPVSRFENRVDKLTRVVLPRVRSVSMSGQMGGDMAIIPAFLTNLRESDIRHPPPAKAFVFIDERDDSIDDGFFAVTTGPRSWWNCPPPGTIEAMFCSSQTLMQSIGAGSNRRYSRDISLWCCEVAGGSGL